MRRQSILVLMMLLFGGLGQINILADSMMYWTCRDDIALTAKIQRANLDGSGKEDLVLLSEALFIALDIANGKMYWPDTHPSRIRCANLDGSEVTDLVTTGLIDPAGIALDIDNGKMYWTDIATNKVQCSNLDGTEVTDLVTTGLIDPAGIALDIPAGKIYWADYKAAKIQRANIDGSGVTDIITTGLIEPTDVILDIGIGKMYWTDHGSRKIQCANLDGTEVTDLITTGLSGPIGIALDISSGKMYWTDSGFGKIQRSNLDGSEVEDLITGLFNVIGIALDVPEPPIGGYIDWADVAVLAGRWLDEGCSDVNDWCGRADIDRDTNVNFADFALLGQYFSEIAPEPGQADSPDPNDGETGVGINSHLSWVAGPNAVSHNVFLGTASPGTFQGSQSDVVFDPGTLDAGTTYYWRITEVGIGRMTAGEVWSFTTSPVPGKAYNPSPSDSAIDVSINANLSWTANFYTTSHDVYFGTNATPGAGEFKGNQTGTTFEPGTLDYETTYYWRIDSVGPGGTTTGIIWSFTTMQDPNLVGWWKFDETSGVIAYDSSGNGNHGQLVDGLGNGLVWAPGEGALNFDGSNNLSRVVVSTVGMSTTEGAIGFWVKLAEPQNRGDGRNGSGYFFGCDNGVKDRILLYMDNSNTELDVRIGDNSETNIITLGTLVWYHIALTWDSGSYVVYLNGIVMSAGVYDGLTTLPSTADIGNNGGSSKQSFHGLMGDLQVYDKSISPSDIQELYEDVID